MRLAPFFLATGNVHSVVILGVPLHSRDPRGGSRKVASAILGDGSTNEAVPPDSWPQGLESPGPAFLKFVMDF